MSEFQKFPLNMTHPAYKPAEQPADPVAASRNGFRGAPAMFPPVLVYTEDQMQEYEAKGYVPNGTMDEAAFGRQVAVPLPPDFKPEEYPKWVKGVLCENADEEAKLTAAADLEVEAEKTIIAPPEVDAVYPAVKRPPGRPRRVLQQATA